MDKELQIIFANLDKLQRIFKDNDEMAPLLDFFKTPITDLEKKYLLSHWISTSVLGDYSYPKWLWGIIFLKSHLQQMLFSCVYCFFLILLIFQFSLFQLFSLTVVPLAKLKSINTLTTLEKCVSEVFSFIGISEYVIDQKKFQNSFLVLFVNAPLKWLGWIAEKPSIRSFSLAFKETHLPCL